MAFATLCLSNKRLPRCKPVYAAVRNTLEAEITRTTASHLPVQKLAMMYLKRHLDIQHLYGETVSWSLAIASTAQLAIGRGSTPLGDTVFAFRHNQSCSSCSQLIKELLQTLARQLRLFYYMTRVGGRIEHLILLVSQCDFKDSPVIPGCGTNAHVMIWASIEPLLRDAVDRASLYSRYSGAAGPNPAIADHSKIWY
jgi:hypothetical protein